MTINFIDKTKADKLAALGFNYSVSKLSDGKEIYSFIETEELMKTLNSDFESGSFYMSPNYCFQKGGNKWDLKTN